MCRTSATNSTERAEHATEVMSAASRLRDVVGRLSSRLKSRGNSERKAVAILCDLCDNPCVLCVRTNPKDVRKRQGGSDRQKTQSSQSEAPQRTRRGRISRQRLWDLCEHLCVLCVTTNPKDVRKRQGGSDQQKTQRTRRRALHHSRNHAEWWRR